MKLKIYMDDHCKVIQNVCVFNVDQKTKMATTAELSFSKNVDIKFSAHIESYRKYNKNVLHWWKQDYTIMINVCPLEIAFICRLEKQICQLLLAIGTI
jgi:hypothetical protein